MYREENCHAKEETEKVCGAANKKVNPQDREKMLQL